MAGWFFYQICFVVAVVAAELALPVDLKGKYQRRRSKLRGYNN